MTTVLVNLLLYGLTTNLIVAFPTEIESDVMSVTGDVTSLPHAVTTAVAAGRREAETQSVPQAEQRGARASAPTCRLLAEDPYVHRKLEKMATSGSTDLVKYEFIMPGGYQPVVDPIKSAASANTTTSSVHQNPIYRPLVGYRVLTSRGRLLLRLPADRDALSLGLLRTTVHHLRVPLVDTPPDCYHDLKPSSGQRSAAVLDLLVRDLAGTAENDASKALWAGGDEGVCRQIIERTSGDVARFAFECCVRIIPTDIRVRCSVLSRDQAVDALYYVPVVAKLIFLLFGPLVLLSLFYRHPTGRSDYVVPLKSELHKTMLVKKVNVETDAPSMTSSANEREMKQFAKFRQLVKNLPSEEIVQVRFRQMEIVVDRSELLGETEYPLDSMFHTAYEALISCAFMRRYPPTAGCCAANCLFGSCSVKFLWLRLCGRHGSTGPNCCRSCRWIGLARIIGWLIAVCVLVPLPYYARMAVYYAGSDADDTTDRRNATDLIDLDYWMVYDPIRWLGPTHPAAVIAYAVYTASAVLVSLFRLGCPHQLETLVIGCVDDYHQTRLSAIVRMVVAHLLLPVEKFGVVFGLVAGVVYWPLALPVCLIVGLCYCLPTVYVVGRLLVGSRPSCFRRLPVRQTASSSCDQANADSLTNGVTSFESCCFLDSISPSGLISTKRDEKEKETTSTSVVTKKPTKRQRAARRRQRLSDCISSLVIGLVLVVFFLSVLVMYAEAFGFLVQIMSMTAVGAVFSAAAVAGLSSSPSMPSPSSGSTGAVLYVILGMWSLVYVIAIYRVIVVGRYLRFSRALFDGLKRHLASEMQSARRDVDRNVAYKYVAGDDDLFLDHESSLPPAGGSCAGGASTATDDSIEYHEGRLHWKIRALALFVDARSDSLLMPRFLFRQLCRLDVPGCPGGSRTTMAVVAWCFGAAVYLSLLGLVVRLVADVAMTSSLTSQAIATLLLGAVPLVVYAVMTCFRSITPGDFSFSGKIRRAILGYTRTWPVHDMSFVREPLQPAANRNLTPGDAALPNSLCTDDETRRRVTTDAKASSVRNGNRRSGAMDQLDMTQVDLLITIRDDSNDHAPAALSMGIENLRSTMSERGSFASVFDRASPPVTIADDHNAPRPSTSGNVQSALTTSGCIANQPTNASRSRPIAGPSDARPTAVDDAVAIAGACGGTGQCRKNTDGVGYALRKQTSASTLPVGDETAPIGESRTGKNYNGVSSSVIVVDLLTKGDVTASFVKYPDGGFNQAPHVGHGPRSAVSTRSLPSYKANCSDGGQQESSL